MPKLAYEEPQWTAWKAYLDSLFKTGGAGYAAISGQLLAIGVDPSERTIRRLFWRDDMENYTVCKWTPRVAGVTAAYVNNAPLRGAFEGDYVLHVHSPVANWWNPVDAFFGRLPEGRISLEARWYRNADIGNGRMRLAIDLMDGPLNIMRWGNVQWNALMNRWECVINPADEVEVVASEDIALNTWNVAKMVVDLSNDTYVSVESNGKLWDLTGRNLPLVRAPVVSSSYSRIALDSSLIAGGYAYFDDVRLYINEV